MAASSPLTSFLSFLSLTSKPPPQPKALPLSHLSVSSSSSAPARRDVSLAAQQEASVTAVVNPALSQANLLFFRSAYNVQVLVDDNEPEERLLGRFRREVMRAGVIQECKRRRFHENKQDEKKRRVRDAAKRNKRSRRPPQRFAGPYKPEGPAVTKREDDGDNWDLPVGDIPY